MNNERRNWKDDSSVEMDAARLRISQDRKKNVSFEKHCRLWIFAVHWLQLQALRCVLNWRNEEWKERFLSVEIDAARPAISQDRQKNVSSEKLFGLENLPDLCCDCMQCTRRTQRAAIGSFASRGEAWVDHGEPSAEDSRLGQVLTLKVWSMWKSSTALRIVHLIDICKTRGKDVDHVADFGPQIYPITVVTCVWPPTSPLLWTIWILIWEFQNQIMLGPFWKTTMNDLQNSASQILGDTLSSNWMLHWAIWELQTSRGVE